MTYGIGSLNDYYVGQALYEGHIQLLRSSIETYEVYEEVKEGGVVVSSDECGR